MNDSNPRGAPVGEPARPATPEYRISPDFPLPIATLLDSVPLRLGDIARRMGYANINKGVRRLQALKQGDASCAKALVPALAGAIGREPAEVWKAVADTRHVLWARRDRQYRANFQPHAIWLGERTRPSPVIGVNRKPLLLDPALPPWEMVARAVASAPPGVPLLGRTTGFWLNYTPDLAVRYDLQGIPQEVKDSAHKRRGEFGLD